ncbi:MAG: PEP-CTERM sorting domain-containing protein [Phycisphaerae bacterium]|nr:PEP-CTERM sorting domain-containing protein [Phycisphaerae bacterium]
MRTILLAVAALLVVGTAALAQPATVEMNAQINLGYTYNTQSPGGNAIYPAFNSDTQTIFADDEVEAEGFTRHNLTTVPGGWWYQYVDLNLAGITTPGSGLNLSAPDSTVTFDTRYYQNDVTNTNPYGDAPVFLRLYTYGEDGNTYLGYRDYSIVYATQPDWNNPPYPTWTTVTVDVNNAPNISEGGVFDVSNVSRIRWYGTDWSGGGDDFVDFKNLVITPEPTALVLLALGGVLVARRRRS